MAETDLPIILVVDDEPAILDALEDLLEDDFKVLKASSGAEGLVLLDSHLVAVVLSDQKMPGMKGEEFLARVAQGHVTTRVLLTGYSDFEDLVRAVNRGHIYAFVSKPWSPHQLKSLVKAAAERFALEKEILHEKNLLSLLLENIPDLISIKDEQGRYLRLNKACARALGVEDAALILGKTDAELGGPLFLGAESREEQVLATGRPDTDLTERTLRQERWYSTTRVTTLSQQGTPVLIGISREITERLENLRVIQDHAGKLERVNEELNRFSFIVAHHLQEPLRSIAGFTDLLRRRSLLRDEAHEYVEYITDNIRRAKSLMRDFQIYLELGQDARPQQICLRKAATESLNSLRALYGDIAFRVEGEAVVTGQSELIGQLFRALLDNALSHGSSEDMVLVHLTQKGDRCQVRIEDKGPGIPEDAHERVFRLFETLEGGARSGLGLALCQKIVALHAGEIWLENLAPRGLAVSFTLVSQSDEEKASLPLGSTASVPEGEASTPLGEGGERRSELEARIALLETFNASAAHDLQEPLRMISSYLMLIKRRHGGTLDPEAAEFLEYAVDGADRMKKLLHALLAYAKFGDYGKEELEIDLGPVVDGVLADLSLAISDTAARVVVGPLPRIPLAEAAARQLFLNLIGNSIKYRGDAEPRVLVEAYEEEFGWRFVVSDNGIGVPEESRAQIFAPFFRAHERADYEGTGLGLATCQRIVETRGGRIWHEEGDTAGGGSRFVFTLPKKVR